MRTLILHLGMNKAGSSTLQAALQGTETATLRYPDLGGTGHAHALVMAYMEGTPPRFGPMPGGREATRVAARERIVAAYEADDRDVLLSSEYLSIFRDPAEIEALLADARPRFDRIRALAYLREPQAYMTSTLQQAARHNDVPDDPFERMYPRYRPRFHPWMKALGKEALDLVCFDRAAFAQGDLLVDFAQRVGLPEGTLRAARPVNESLTAEAVAVLLCRHRARAGRAPGRGHGELLQALAGFGETRLAFVPALLDKTIATRARDVAWAEVHMGRAFPPPPADRGRSWPDVPALRAYGETLAEPLLAWQRRTVPDARPPTDTVPDIIDAMAHALAPRRGPLSLVRRVLGR
ncbi:hypothetical protein [Jannaschia seohaensis]|uniref:Sulfotransferase family protein n=1 Tax=Jannaschia seohaensis TaxID=475081 RepID=A0A2Y9AZH4_9RHOB|nr:hypothetical protein [Jannaschia seohaensis]PWJ16224.1 hypothetical protein BCF38_109109 [Jannaschia seohaensis]SSA49275.1 hypothetical protein SAMN05421539_109109 [Jannaschia seohaensis]